MNSNIKPLANTLRASIQSALDHAQKEAVEYSSKSYESILATNINNYMKPITLRMPLIIKGLGISKIFNVNSNTNIDCKIIKCTVPGSNLVISNIFKVIFSINTVSSINRNDLNNFEINQGSLNKLVKINFNKHLNFNKNISIGPLLLGKQFQKENIYNTSNSVSSATVLLDKKVSSNKLSYKPIMRLMAPSRGKITQAKLRSIDSIIRGMGVGKAIYDENTNEYTVDNNLDLNLFCVAVSNSNTSNVKTFFSTIGTFFIFTECDYGINAGMSKSKLPDGSYVTTRSRRQDPVPPRHNSKF